MAVSEMNGRTDDSFLKTEWGGFHEPPYTEEEQLDIARRARGVVAFKSHQHRQPPPAAKAVVGSIDGEK